VYQAATLPHHVDAARNRSLSGAAEAAKGRWGSPWRARPAFALILMGDWCASLMSDTQSPTTQARSHRTLQRPALRKERRDAAN